MEPGQCEQGPRLDTGWRAGRVRGTRKGAKAYLDDAFLLRDLERKTEK